MNKSVELPLIEPVYRTFNFEAASSAVLKENQSIRNWYLNEIMMLQCSTRFLNGFTSPELFIVDLAPVCNPYLEKIKYELKYLGSGVHKVIRNLINDGYYVFFWGIDDYYFKGKSWYHEKHFPHDGLIIGYNMEEENYTVYAYDQNWLLRTFKTPKHSLTKAINSALSQNQFGHLYGIKPKKEIVSINIQRILESLKEYLKSSSEDFPSTNRYHIKGVDVHKYILLYLDKLYSGEISWDRMDRRIFRLIWNHKKVMLERIEIVEEELGLDKTISKSYKPLVKETENMRMLYASYNKRRRDSILLHIKEKLIYVYEKEIDLLTKLVEIMEDEHEKRDFVK